MKKIQKIIHRVKSKSKLNKRQLVFLSITLLIMIITVGAVLFSQQKWNEYSNTYNQQFNSVDSDIENALLQISSNSNAGQGNILSEISQLQIKLYNESEASCDVDRYIKWQSFIDSYSKEINACLQQKSHTLQILDMINKVIAYLKDDQELADIISNADSDTNKNNQPENWNQIEAVWRLASKNTSELVDASYRFDITKEAAVNSMNSVADAWSQLSKANDSKNRQQYIDATTNLSKAYETLNSISDTNTSQLDIITSELCALL